MSYNTQSNSDRTPAATLGETQIGDLTVIVYASGAVGLRVPGFRGYSCISAKTARELFRNIGAVSNFVGREEFAGAFESKEEKLVKFMQARISQYETMGLDRESASILADRDRKKAGL